MLTLQNGFLWIKNIQKIVQFNLLTFWGWGNGRKYRQKPRKYKYI